MIGLDTWFFFQLKKEDPKAIDFWKSVIRGKEKVAVSVLVLYELGINMYAKGEPGFYEEVKGIITRIKNIMILDLNLEIIEKAMKIKQTHHSPTLDSLIVSSYIVNKYDQLVSEDAHMIELATKNVIKIKKLK